MSSLRAVAGPVASAIALTVLFGSSATPAAGQCDAEGLENPYGNDPYGLVEWQGHYYDAGWFHLRRRAVGSGEWADFGGGISGGGAYTLTESMLPWNGRLVIGGAFLFAGGLSAPNIVAWNGESFEPLGSGLDGEVLSLVEWNGRLVAGGAFTASGDGATLLKRVAVFDEKADAWQPLGDGLEDLPAGYGTWAIGQLCVHEGELYATGRFRRSGGTTLNGIARFDEASNAWRPLGSGIAGMSNGNVGTALASFDGMLWMSGWFFSVDGVSAPWMARWDGDAWSAAPPGPTRHCLKLRVLGDRLFGVGPFPFTIGGVQYDLAVFEDGAWQGLGNANVNWPNDVSLASDGASLLVCGDFNMFNGVATGSLVRLDCGYSTPCPADLDGDGIVGASDLATVLARWGSADVAADLDADGQVGPGDLAMMLASWNSCG